ALPNLGEPYSAVSKGQWLSLPASSRRRLPLQLPRQGRGPGARARGMRGYWISSTDGYRLALHVASAVALFERPNRRLSSVRYTYLAEDGLHMDLDRCLHGTARTGDHLVGLTLYQAPEDLLLTLCQTVTNSN